jgi:DNA-binding NarL/FixJ family response regulator
VEGAVIVQAIRDVLAGRIHLSSEASDLLLHRLTGSPQEQHNEEDPVRRLSDREIQVFSMIGEGRSMAEIAVELNISQRTVETYRDNIKNKLDLDSSSEVIRRAAQWLVME